MAAPTKTIERAYALWKENGQNISATERALKDEGYGITRPTLIDWREKYNWEERAARAEAEKEKKADACSVEALLNDLLTQKQRYEDYFATLPRGKMDNQAVYGYNGILKTIIDLKQKTAGTAMPVPEDSPQRIIKTPQDAVGALQEAIENKLNRMLADPAATSLKWVQEMERALVLIDKMKEKYKPGSDEGAKKGLSKQTIENIKAKVLGIAT